MRFEKRRSAPPGCGEPSPHSRAKPIVCVDLPLAQRVERRGHMRLQSSISAGRVRARLVRAAVVLAGLVCVAYVVALGVLS